MSLGGGYSGSSSQQSSQSRQGMQEPDAKALSPTTLGTREYANQIARQAVESPFGMYRGQSAGSLLGVDPRTGLPSSYWNMLSGLANKYFADASAGGSLRGQNTPENTSNVVGSALTNFGLATAPYLQDTWKYAAELPTRLNAANLDYLNNVSQQDTAAMGGSSSSSGSSNAFGFNLQGDTRSLKG